MLVDDKTKHSESKNFLCCSLYLITILINIYEDIFVSYSTKIYYYRKEKCGKYLNEKIRIYFLDST